MVKSDLKKARCDIANFLRQNGPSLSSNIASYLQSECGLSAEAARQRIRRASPPVRRLTDIGLPDRTSFLFHTEHADTEFFFERLAGAYIAKKSNIGDALLSIKGRGGYVHQGRFATISGAPNQAVAGHPIAKELLETILKVGLLKEAWEDDSGSTYSTQFSSPVPKEQYVAVLNTEKIFSDVVRSWLERLNFATAVASRFSGGQPGCNNFDFDIAGRARIRHFFSAGSDSCDAFTVGDVNLSKELLSIEDVRYFIRKVEIASYSRVRQNIIPFLFAYDFSGDCIALLKKCGVIHARVKHVFGNNFSELLKNLCLILSNISVMLSRQPECLSEITDQLLKFEGRTLNLRSVAFQAIVSQLYYNLGYHLEIDKNVVSPSGRPAEIDVFANRLDELICIECKAFLAKNNCPASSVNWWIRERLPRIIEWKRAHFGGKKTTIVYWVTTSFEDDELIVRPNLRDDIAFVLKSREDIVAELKGARLSKTLSHFNEHFVQGYI